MWQFAVGLYLVFFEDGVLLLAAALNFCSSGTVLLFGGLLGNWVDHNSRLKGNGSLTLLLFDTHTQSPIFE